MGIKRFDRKYSAPRHPWRGERISSEAEIMNRYGLKNHREIWRALFKLSRWRELARHLIVNKDQKRTDELLNPLINIGCLKEKKLESVFEITPEDVLERRLQTVVFRKGLARTIREARLLITHKHIYINNKVVNAPGYIVSKDEEDKITSDITIAKTDEKAGKAEEASANEKASPAPLSKEDKKREQHNNSNKNKKNADAGTKKK